MFTAVVPVRTDRERGGTGGGPFASQTPRPAGQVKFLMCI